MSTKEVEAYNNKRLLASQLIGIIAGGIANGDKGANTGYKITTSADTYNRQLHQREIDFINNKNNIESFKSKLQTTTNKIYSDDEAKSILAKAAVSLTDKSFNEAYRQSLSSNDLYNIELATNFIKQSSFYNTTLDNTNAFNPNKKQYEDRYIYLDSFTNNREFYDKNLKVDTKLSNDIANFATGFAKGGINLVKDTITGVYYLVSNPKEFVNALANIPNIPSEIKEGIDKGELDIVLGDYESVTARDTEFIAGLTGSGAVANKAGKAAWDRFGKKPSDVTSDVTKIDNPTSNTNVKHNGNSSNDGVAGNGDKVATGTTGNIVENKITSKETVLEIFNTVGIKSTGKGSKGVRLVKDNNELNLVWDKLTKDAKDIKPVLANDKTIIIRKELDDGTIIKYRPTSKSGGATIEIEPVNGGIRKIHYKE